MSSNSERDVSIRMSPLFFAVLVFFGLAWAATNSILDRINKNLEVIAKREAPKEENKHAA